jgi:hypothetical protein
LYQWPLYMHMWLGGTKEATVVILEIDNITCISGFRKGWHATLF